MTVFESGQNIRTVPAANAFAGSGIHVTPYEYGQNRTAQKQLLRSRWEVENAGLDINTSLMQMAYQKDTDARAADSPSWAAFAGGAGLGKWTLAAQPFVWNGAGDAGSALDGTGSGVLWTEYDGSGGVHGSTAYPTFKRIRWLYNISGGLGVAPAALLSHSWQRLEYAFKFYVINTMLKLECNLDQPNSPGLYSTPDQLVAAVQVLQAADYGKTIITAVGPDAQSYTCVISKFLSNYTILDHDGPKQAIVQLTLQSVKLYGLAI
jgi:hypothetical protein